MRSRGYRFRPRLWPTIATVLILPALVSLGYWQLDRAHQKKELLDAYTLRSRQDPISLLNIKGSVEDLRYRAAIANGHYDTGHQFLLDNKVVNGRPGFHVLTPLRMENGEAILVNRGWAPMGALRSDLPDTNVNTDARLVSGIIDVPPQKVFSLGEGEDRNPGWPKVLQRIRIDLQSQQLGYQLAPIILLLSPEDNDGYVRDWHPTVRFGPEKHQGYAFQWFALATALVVIYISVNLKRKDQA